MTTEQINKALSQKELPSWHNELLTSTKQLVDMSRSAMSSQYGKWDLNNDVYRGYRQPDEQDKKSKERGEPEKMIVPMTYSQVHTFAAFCFALYTQREIFFELQGMNAESHEAAKTGEALVQRDLTFNVWEGKLFQLLTDVARFGICVTKTHWCRKTQLVRETVVTPPASFMGFQVGQPTTEVVEKEVTKFLGNEILSISPYRFYPDTRLPLTRFQEGEFCASEDEYSMTSLQQMQYDGYYFGVEHVSMMTKKDYDGRGASRLSSGFKSADITTSSEKNKSGTVCVTEVQRVLTPSTFMLDGKPLDKKVTRPTKYLIVYANDQRIIRFQPLGYLHEEFTYDVGFFSPDQQEATSMSLADTIDQLQSTMSWFINARITNVRKVIQNFLVVDPEGIEIGDVQKRLPIIRLKSNAGARGIDRWIKQLNVTDVTTNHLADCKFLQDLVQLTTGINDNILGQFNGGRRSAQEARNTFASASARLKMIAVLLFRMALEPMARKMLSNLRDGLDEETMVKVIGMDGVMDPKFKGVTKADLVGSYDFTVFDGTLPSEKGARADVFAQILTEFMGNPQAAIAIGIDPRLVFLELMELRGIRNPERFMLPSAPQTPGQPGQPGGMPPQQPQVAPGQQPAQFPLF